MEIIYQDNRILVCLKPFGVVSTDEPGGLPDLVRQSLGGGAQCVRTVHRLDQVVGGVMVLARSRAAARILSEQVAARQFEKEYLAVLEGVPEYDEGELRDLLGRDKAKKLTYVADAPGKDVQEAVLRYRLLDSRDGFSLVKIHLLTGRTHQIRCQFSSRGLPLAGDCKYGAQHREMEGIGLWSHLIAFRHPQTDAPVSFQAPPPRTWPWTLFPALWTEEERA